MAKFCSRCGAKLDETTGMCPCCSANRMEKELDATRPVEMAQTDSKGPSNRRDKTSVSRRKRKARKTDAKRAKRAQWSIGKRVRRFCLKVVLLLLLLAVFAVGIMGALVYFDVPNVPVLSILMQSDFLETLNERAIVVEEKISL